MLDDAVGTGDDLALVTVVESHPVGRFSAFTEDFQHSGPVFGGSHRA